MHLLNYAIMGNAQIFVNATLNKKRIANTQIVHEWVSASSSPNTNETVWNEN